MEYIGQNVKSVTQNIVDDITQSLNYLKRNIIMPTDNSSKHYIASWFYFETADEASYYPQMGRKGNSPLAHSVYMQIQVPFFVTFRHYNPDAHLLFFTNLEKIPAFLSDLFSRLNVEVVTLSYSCKPPKGWYFAWANQFYLYDILRYMEARLNPTDVFTIIDADCICQRSLEPFFKQVIESGSGLYVNDDTDGWVSSDLNQQQATEIYRSFYQKEPVEKLYYYGGEFISLRGDKVREVNKAYTPLWNYNLKLFSEKKPKLNQEALMFSVLAEHLQIRNNIGNGYIKRIWTNPNHFNCVPEDQKLTIWHLPYEKRRGLHYLYIDLLHDGYRIKDENEFWKKASKYCGVPSITLWKKMRDLRQKLRDIFIR